MGEALREMTYDEQIADFIIHVLAIETPFSVKRDLISHLLSLTYRHERDIKDALYDDALMEFLRVNKDMVKEILEGEEDDEDGLCESDTETDSEG